MCEACLMRAGVVAIDDLIAMAFGFVPIDKKLNPLDPNDFAKISNQLAGKLAGHVFPKQEEALRSALKTLDVDWKSLGLKEKSAITREANRILLKPIPKIMPAVEQTLHVDAQGLATSVKEHAVKEFKLRIPTDLSALDETIAEFTAKSHGNYVSNHLGERAALQSLKARAIAEKGVRNGLSRDEIARAMKKELGGALQRDQNYFKVVAASFVNRSRVSQHITSFNEAGIQFYIWESVMDEATTEQCRFMHEKRFPVDQAVDRLQRVSESDDPEALKTEQPWLRVGVDENDHLKRQSLYYKDASGTKQWVAAINESAMGKPDKTGSFAPAMNDKALQDNGLTLPPIHGLCRSTVVPDVSTPPPTGKPQPPPVKPSAKPPVVIPPSKKTPEQKALDKLSKFPPGTTGFGTQHPFPHESDPEWMDAYSPDMIDDAYAAGQAKARKPKVEDVFAPASTVNETVVKDLIKDPTKLAAALKGVKIVKYGGKLYVYEGNEAFIAERLMGKRRATSMLLDLDKMPKPKPQPALTKPKTAPKPKPKPKPAPGKPPPTQPDPDSHQNILHQNIGGARGSNEGGFYRGADGVERYVKFYDDEAQASMEHLANEMYRKLGHAAPESTVFKTKAGKWAYASKIMPGGKTLGEVGLTKANATKAMKGFVADVLTGNWDAAGLTLDNMMVLPNGNVVRIDNGGTFLFRAKEGRKPMAAVNAITEWEKLFQSGVNPAYAKVAAAAGYDGPESFAGIVVKQIDSVLKMQKAAGGWAAYVKQVAPNLPNAERLRVAKMLSTRTELLKAKRDELKSTGRKPSGPKGKARYVEKQQSRVLPGASIKLESLPETTLPDHYREGRRGVVSKLPSGESLKAYRQRIRRQTAKVSVDERDSISSFTGCAYSEIRHVEEQGMKGDPYDIKMSREISMGVKKAMPEPGTAYRGIHSLPKAAIDGFLKQKTFKLGKFGKPGTTSTTWDPNVAVDRFMSGPNDSAHDTSKYKVLYRINGRSQIAIEHISNFEEEHELLFEKDSKFKVTGLSRLKGTKRVLVIECEEI